MPSLAIRLGSLVLAGLVITTGAQAGTLDLGNYTVGFAAALPDVPEAGAIAYNWDRNSLMVIGDEGQTNEYALDGTVYPGVYDYVGGTAFDDPEGITYIGNGRYVIAEERTTRISAVATAPLSQIGTETRYYFQPADPAYQYTVSGGANWGNSGLEGISYDSLTGGFFGVKQENPQGVFFIDKDFDTPNSAGTTTSLFDPALLGLVTLSDIKTFSTVTAFQGTDIEENLLILSTSSMLLLEVSRSGEVLSSFDLNGILGSTGFAINTIEGVTFDNAGNIYLAAELGEGPGGGTAALIGLTLGQQAAVPEPSTWAMMIGGFALVGSTMRRRAHRVSFV